MILMVVVKFYFGVYLCVVLFGAAIFDESKAMAVTNQTDSQLTVTRCVSRKHTEVSIQEIG